MTAKLLSENIDAQHYNQNDDRNNSYHYMANPLAGRFWLTEVEHAAMVALFL